YLHAPERTKHFEETFGAVNELHKGDNFRRFGFDYLARRSPTSSTTFAIKLVGSIRPYTMPST
ncbi:hypothetical protein V1505DRAFT_317852, partial [Lipomyces doorenjongii]